MVTQGHLVCKALTSGGFSYTETVYGMAKNSGSTVSAENAFAPSPWDTCAPLKPLW